MKSLGNRECLETDAPNAEFLPSCLYILFNH
jgi:hypothetical protein